MFLYKLRQLLYKPYYVNASFNSNSYIPRTPWGFDLTTHFIVSGDTTTNDSLEASPATPTLKPSRKRRIDRVATNNNNHSPAVTTNSSSNPATDYSSHNNNNNNHFKNERLSPGTPDTSSRSRSVTPSSASHPDTPPAVENNIMPSLGGRNYSDFMRSLAAKYNNPSSNE